MTVEFGTIHTGKTGFTAHRHPTSTTHTGSIYHQRIEADNGFNTIFQRGQCNELHHDHRTDCNHLIVLFALIVDQIAQQGGHHTFETSATVIGCNIDVAGNSLHLLHKN